MLHSHFSRRWTCDAGRNEDFHVLEAWQVALDRMVERPVPQVGAGEGPGGGGPDLPSGRQLLTHWGGGRGTVAASWARGGARASRRLCAAVALGPGRT